VRSASEFAKQLGKGSHPVDNRAPSWWHTRLIYAIPYERWEVNLGYH